MAERSKGDWIDAHVHAAIRTLFPEPDQALAVAGAKGHALPAASLEPDSDPAEPLLQRLRVLDQTLRSHLDLLAEQVDELSESPEDLVRLRAEGIATLIALRELHGRVPELDVATGLN